MLSNSRTKKPCRRERTLSWKKKAPREKPNQQKNGNPSIYTGVTKNAPRLLHFLHILFGFPNYVLKTRGKFLIELHMQTERFKQLEPSCSSACARL